MGHNKFKHSFCDSDTCSNIMGMEDVELAMDKAKEAREAPKGTRPSRKPLQDIGWGLKGDCEVANGSKIQTHESLP